MYTLKCGCGEIGCGATAQVENIGEDAGGFVFETFNGGFYLCANDCDDANVDIYDADGKEVDLNGDPVEDGMSLSESED